MTINIMKYAPYFHDGIVYDIKSSPNSIDLLLESAALEDDWNEDNIILSKRDSITGKLHIYNIISIKINDVLYMKQLVMNYDNGDISDLEIEDGKVTLMLSWENYPPKPVEHTPFFKLEIVADKIEWEHIPTLFDEYWAS